MKTLQLTSMLVFMLLFINSMNAQTPTKTLLGETDFESGIAGPLNATGNNVWIINNIYSGNGVYADVPSEDSTLAAIGKISYPNSNYLHITGNSSNPKNANFNFNSASTSTAELQNSFCTLGFTGVIMVFWWTAGGTATDSSAYGQIEYSTNGGSTWNLTYNTDGQIRYYNMNNDWKYSVIRMPQFLGQNDLRFRFVWKNVTGSHNSTLSWGIDDVIIVGESPAQGDTTAVPITFTAQTPSPDSVCQEDFNNTMTLSFTSSSDMCAGVVFAIEISDSTGSFADPFLVGNYWLGAGVPLPGGTPISLSPFFIPSFIPIAPTGCYKYRVRTIQPPFVEVVASGCFKIIDCSDSISPTIQPVITEDPIYQGHTCICSKISAKFFSYGAFNTPNVYNLELSDSSGDFANGQVIGSGGGSDTWTGLVPPGSAYLPPFPLPCTEAGTASGIIPKVPPGCNYYVRIVSADPVEIGKPWGPFCIAECDMKFNDCQDISVCITNTIGVDTLIPININEFDSIAKYPEVNQFKIQLIKPNETVCEPGAFQIPPPPEILYEGVLGTLVDTTSGKILLSIPRLPVWLGMGLDIPGSYLMRVIATNSTKPDDTLSNLVNFSIGGVSGNGPDITIDPLSYPCNTGAGQNFTFTINNYTPTSTYFFNFKGVGSVTLRPGEGPAFSLSSAYFSAGANEVSVQEQSGGCFGPSATFNFYMSGAPDLDFDGDVTPCQYDTVLYTANFLTVTYYEWKYSGGRLIDSANNQITIVWDGIGTGFIELMGLNECWQTVKRKIISILPKTVSSVSHDTTICRGDTAQLSAENKNPITSSQLNIFTWTILGDTLVMDTGRVIKVAPDTTTTYNVKIDYYGCDDDTQVTVTVIPNAKADSGKYEICSGDSVQLGKGVEGSSILWTPSTFLNNDTIAKPISIPDTSIKYTVFASYKNGCKNDTGVAVIIVSEIIPCEIGPDITIIKGKSTTLIGCSGEQYHWSPPFGLNDTVIKEVIASPDTTTLYVFKVTDINGCVGLDTIEVKVIDKPKILVPGGFSPNGDPGNRILYAINLGIKKLLEFKVYNRWGEVVFETDDINVGWDGNYRGVPQEIGTYVYYIKAITIEDETVDYKGSVTLLR